MPQAALFEEQRSSTDFEIIRKGRVVKPRFAYLLINSGHDIDASIAVKGVVGQSEVIDLRPPGSIGTGDLNINVIHSQDRTPRVKHADFKRWRTLASGTVGSVAHTCTNNLDPSDAKSP